MNYKRLGNYIQPVNIRNTNLGVTTLLGVSIKKVLMPSIANTIGTNMKTYKIIKQNQFAYGPVTSRNGDKISIALLEKYEIAIVSQAYTVFEIIDEQQVLPEYLMMWFRRPEFDRFARFKSHGSAREVFDWDELCDTQLPIPTLEKQQQIVAEYNTVTHRINLNNQLNQKLEATAQALYKHWFVDFEFPIKFSSSGGVPEGGGGKKRNSQNYFSLPYNPKLKDRAKALRKAGNLAEVLFWKQVKNKQFKGLDFDRQKIIGNYIVDFYCANLQLVVEIDGSSHNEKQEYDAKRDAYLQSLGLLVLHYTDQEVKKQIDSVLRHLGDEVDDLPPRLSGTPPEEGKCSSKFPSSGGVPAGAGGYKSSGGKMVYNEELDKDIPVGWSVERLGDFSKIKGGKRMPLGTSLIKDKTNHTYIKVADLGKSKYVQFNNKFEFVPTDVAPKISRYIVHKNDVIISIVGTIGVVKILGDSLDGANLTENCMKITELNKFSPSYLYHYLVSKKGREEIQIRNVGAVQAKLPMYNIESFPIIIPKENVMKKFDEIINDLDKKINILVSQSQTLQELQSLLLAKMTQVAPKPQAV